MRFSIIIPNLNSPGVDLTIAALEKQTLGHDMVEVIVVGLDIYDRIRTSKLVRFDRSEQPLSPAQARNRGAAQAKGEILVFTDADCIPRPDWLSVLAGQFTDPDISVVGGGVEFDTVNPWTLADNVSMFHEYMAFQPAGQRKQLPSLNLAIRKSVFLEVGGFDERYPRPSGEDADLTIRLRKQGYPLIFEPCAVVFHQPPRYRLPDLLRHGYYQGKYSTKVDPRYAADEGLPPFLRTRHGLILSAPFLAAAITLRIFIENRNLRIFWRIAPVIYLIKLAWCGGAAGGMGGWEEEPGNRKGSSA